MTRIIEDITNFIFVSDEEKKADIIFLPGGTNAEVPEKGAELYHKGLAPILLPSGKYAKGSGGFGGVSTGRHTYRGKYSTECDFYTDVLAHAGISLNNIVRENRAEFTKQNADFSREKCDSLGIEPKTAIICCKPFHARRCLIYYTAAFPHTEFIVCPAEYKGINRDDWYKSEEGFNTVMGELAKCGSQVKEDIFKYLQL